MTNNPTIDGVSRELIENTAQALKFSGAYGDLSVELFKLLDAPVVEREPVAKLGWAEIVALVNEVLGCEAHEFPCAQGSIGHKMTGINFNSLARVIDRVRQQATPEVAALQSTIAQLQARVQELESGRGEPVAYVLTRDNEVCYEADDGIVISNTPGDETDLYKWKPVYFEFSKSSPMDERSAFESWANSEGSYNLQKNTGGDYTFTTPYQAWAGWQARACLDATAALNGERK